MAQKIPVRPVCGTMQHYQWMAQQYPQYEQNQQQIELFNQIIEQQMLNDTSKKSFPPVYTIPVVFHVVYQNGTENIPDYRLTDQLQVLNEDFRRLNADASSTPAAFQSVAADAEIQFCLAQRDPSNNASTGIVRKSTTDNSFTTDDQVKFTSQGGDNAWPCGSYLNIWVCDLGGGLLGYAQFPGGSCNSDGVVLNYRYVGTTGSSAPYDLGRTGTHEVGHWLNLRHIWGDANCGNDLVGDTPTQDSEHYGCPTHPLHTNACGGGTSPNGEMFMNYMDYTDDGCMNLFTNGQRTRMRNLFAVGGAREALLSSQGCVSPVALDAGIATIISPTGTFCATTITPVVTLRNYGSTTLTSVEIKYQLDANPVNTFNWSGSLTSGSSTNVTLPSMAVTAGAHTFTSYTNNPNGSADQNSSNDQQTSNFTVTAPSVGTPVPFWQGFNLATFPPTGWTLDNGGDPVYTWARTIVASGWDTSTASTRMDNYSSNTSIAGDIDALETPAVNFASVSAPVRLDFSVAYCRYNASLFDRLIVYYSTDCGNAWVSIYDKSGTTLATAPDNTNAFDPTPSQWRRETINIDALAGNNNVMFRFENISGWGNYLYIDDVNMYGNVSVPAPVADFSASAITVCQGQTVTFTDLSTNTPTSWSWTFTGGTPGTSTLQNPTVTYNTAGTYTVTLTATNGGGSDGETKINYITVNQAATTNAGIDAAICAGSTYTLAGSIGGSATGSTWTTSGTGTFSNASSLTATYTPSASDITMGNVTLTLTTNDPSGPCPAVTDQMVLTINAAATSNAGSDAAICAGSTYTLSGSVGGSATFSTWTTSGSGTFNNASSLTATYTPSAGDITMGSVTLTLTTNDPAGPCTAASDQMVLTINAAATANAGTDATICSGNTYTLSGSIGGSATSSTWMTSGSGTFNNASLLTAIYTPSATDLSMGSVTLTLATNDPAGPCPSVSDAMVLTINAAATANAGTDATICSGSAYTLAGTIGGGATSALWSTSGSGTFNNPNSLTATYTPSATDISMGSVTLTLTTNDPAGPCTSVSDAMVITINPAATVNAGADAAICAGSTYTLSGAIGGGASSSAWTTSGSGTFDNASSVTATYTPSGADITMGSVTLTLTTNDPAGPCNAASDQMLLNINTQAQVNAGPDMTICAGNSYTLAGASMGGSASSVTWTSSGSGSFNNPLLLNPTYTPSGSDISSGSISLTVTTNDPAGPCPVVSDLMVLTINTAATANAGADASICQGDTYTMAGSIGGSATSSTWTTSGSGTFTNPNSLTAIYTPSVSDITAGSVTITLTTNDPAGPCSSVFDQMVLTINSSATVYAGTDAGICAGNANALSGMVGGGASSASWTTSGTGTFDNANSLTAIYSPSAADDAMGSVTLTLTTNDPAGPCPSASDAMILNIYSLPVISIAPINASCSGSSDGSLTANVSSGTPAYSYFWNTTPVQTTSIAAGLPAGSYSVTVTDSKACSASASAVITEPAVIVLSDTSTPANCGTPDGTATVTAGGGTTPYSYLWDSNAGNQTASSATGLSAGSYSVTVTDNNGCSASSLVPVSSGTLSVTFSSVTGVPCYGLCTGMAAAGVSGGTAPYTYLWNSSETGSSASSLCGGSQPLTVTDNNGCVNVSSVWITEPAILSVLMTTTDISCNGLTDGSAVASVNGGTPSYTYQWSNSSTQTSATGLSAGNHTVTITDNNSCTATSSISIGEPAGLTIAIDSVRDESCPAADDGYISVIASGGTASYTYSWSNGTTTSTLTAISSGTYTVTLSDANGCSVLLSQAVGSSNNLSALITSFTNASCSAGNDGSAEVTASGGTLPYTYQWSMSAGFQTTSTATGLAAGEHFISVTDAVGCQVTDSVTITAGGTVASLIASVNDVTCFGANDGSIQVTASGGTAPYSYLWSDPQAQTTATATGLGGGTYYVTVSDAAGCSVIDIAVVKEPDEIVLVFSTTNATCGQSNGTATVNASGGFIPYSYQWNDGSSQTTNSASGLAAGVYTAIVTDNKGCTSAGSILVSNDIPVVSIYSYSNVSCAGACTGTASTSLTGGAPPFTFSWSNGATTGSASGLCSGNVTVTVTDANGCITSDMVAIIEPPAIAINISVAAPVSCYGSTNGTLSAAISGGVAPYSYLWSDPLAQTPSFATGLSSGNYTVTVTDAYSCTNSSSFYLPQPFQLSVSVTSTEATCGAPDGTATASGTGGTQPYSYYWDDPMAQTTQTATGLSAGSYNVTLTDNYGCVFTASAIVNNTIPQVTVDTIIDASCSDICNGIASVTATGGITPYTYLWDNGQTNFYANGLCPGSHAVSVIDSNSCIASALFTIGSPDTLEISVISVSSITCYGLSDGSISVASAGGTPPCIYQWNDAMSQTSSNATGLSPGTYSVTLTDSNGCMATATQAINEPAALTVTLAATDASCGISNGSATANPSGGTPPYNYFWSTGSNQSSVTGLAAGAYSVTVYDDNGCTAVSTVSIFNNNLVASVTSSTNASCSGLCDGSATVTVTSGSGPFNYLWDNGESGAIASALCAGIHTVSVTDINSCITSASVTISESVTLTISLAASADVTCNGLADGSITVNVTGGTTPYSFQWNDPGMQTSVTATGLNGGSYIVTATDANSCLISDTFPVNEPLALSLSMSATSATCGLANGTASVTPSGGNLPYTYLWNPQAGNQTTSSATGLSAGSYSVAVTDNNGCTASSSVNVNNDIPVVNSITGTNITCYGFCDGTATVSVSNGTLPYTYLWDNGGTVSVVSALCPGIKAVTVTDAVGCMTTAAINITQPSQVTLSLVSSSDLLCGGTASGNATVSASGGVPGYSYQWDVQAGNQTTSTASGLGGGTYSVTVTDGNGCSDMIDSIIIFEPPILTLDLAPDNITCIGATNGSVDATASGGVSPYTYLWSDGSTTEDIFNLPAGVYYLTMTDRNNCTLVDSAVISAPGSALVLTWVVSPLSCTDSTDGAIDVTVTGGTAPYFYNWSNGSATQDLSGLAPGSYDLIVTDFNGCTGFMSDTIDEPTPVTITASSVNVTCAGANDGSVSVTAGGGTPPYSYLWSDPSSATTSTVTGLNGDKYYITVTDNSGCKRVGYIFVQEPLPVTLSVFVTNASCSGVCNGTTAVISSGGTGVYAYQWDTAAGSQTTPSLTGLCAGTYRVTVTDEKGCSAQDTAVSGYNFIIDILATVTNVSCEDSRDGKIEITVSGGQIPYSYSWSNGSTIKDIENLDTGIFTLTIRDNANCIVSDTMHVGVGGEPCFLIYDAFSPNDDGANDYWEIRGIDKFPDAVVEVYNRWGSLIFQSKPYSTPWNGTYNGKELPEGVYYYIISINGEKEYTGTVTILR